MSVAVAVKKGGEIVLAADTQTNFGSFKVKPDNHRAAKIRRVGPVYVAATGWGKYDDILENYLAGRRPPDLTTRPAIFSFFMKLWKDLHEKYSFVKDQCAENDDSPFGDLDASFLIASPRGIYEVAGDMSVTAFEHYFAIGSGGEFAMGALFALYDTDLPAEALARRAVEAAIAFNVHCGGEIDVVRLRAAPSPRTRRGA
ncbi:MAG: hypothetical protein M1457_04760 [bacterium]|nr:hypothetical protein [bacterium]